VAVNLIANRPAGSGYLQLFPAGAIRPVDSTLNHQQGRNAANFEVVAVPANGHLSVFSTTATKVIVQLRGNYTTPPLHRRRRRLQLGRARHRDKFREIINRAKAV
jgi:hypothetical protein